MNIFRMLSAILRGLNPHPTDVHIRALQSAYAREAALQWHVDDLEGHVVTRQQLASTVALWTRK